MVNNAQIRILVGCVLVIVAVVLLIQGHAIAPKDLISSSSYAVTGVGFLLVCWDRWLWSWRIFHPWLSKRPDLRGTWKGELLSSYADAATKERGPIEVYLVIRQTNSSVDARLYSAESSSVSLSGVMIGDSADLNTLIITYRNEPLLFKREQSPINYGAMLLNIRGDHPYQLDGQYWTDRLTRGEIKFAERFKRVTHDFRQASLTQSPEQQAMVDHRRQ